MFNRDSAKALLILVPVCLRRFVVFAGFVFVVQPFLLSAGYSACASTIAVILERDGKLGKQSLRIARSELENSELDTVALRCQRAVPYSSRIASTSASGMFGKSRRTFE